MCSTTVRRSRSVCPSTPNAISRKNAYRVELDHNRLVWVTLEDDKKIRSTSAPDASFVKHLKTQVLSCLPIELLL